MAAAGPPAAQLLAGQDILYHGRFAEAAAQFGRMAAEFPASAAPLALRASALIWQGEAAGDETWQADAIDTLLTAAIAVGRRAADLAATDRDRREALFWLGTAYGYRARQAELQGSWWRASRDARAMRQALESALALDSACIDCLLPLGLYDYALARAGSLARLVASIIGLGSGDATRGMERLRRAAAAGTYTRTEAQWVLANMLRRETDGDLSRDAEAKAIGGDLLTRYPANPVFRAFMERRDRP